MICYAIDHYPWIIYILKKFKTFLTADIELSKKSLAISPDTLQKARSNNCGKCVRAFRQDNFKSFCYLNGTVVNMLSRTEDRRMHAVLAVLERKPAGQAQVIEQIAPGGHCRTPLGHDWPRSFFFSHTLLMATSSAAHAVKIIFIRL